MEIPHTYLSSSKYRHRIEGTVEASVTLQGDLEAETRATQRMWAKREKQLERALANTAGLYGDFQGIIGASLPQIATLELPALIHDAPDDAIQLTDAASD